MSRHCSSGVLWVGKGSLFETASGENETDKGALGIHWTQLQTFYSGRASTACTTLKLNLQRPLRKCNGCRVSSLGLGKPALYVFDLMFSANLSPP